MGSASDRIRFLVTGFGAFPGVRHNPAASLVRDLEKHRARLGRLGIGLDLAILPVAYAEIAPNLATLALTHRPDAILHLGLATRRKCIAIETRAVNRRSLLRPDVTGATAASPRIAPGAPHQMRSTFAAPQIAAALADAGLACRLSHDAGEYICNEALFLSLENGHARQSASSTSPGSEAEIDIEPWQQDDSRGSTTSSAPQSSRSSSWREGCGAVPLPRGDTSPGLTRSSWWPSPFGWTSKRRTSCFRSCKSSGSTSSSPATMRS
jgi:pyroglutamyl-peptidase